VVHDFDRAHRCLRRSAIRLKSAEGGEISGFSDDQLLSIRGRSRRPGDPGRSCSHMAFPETKFVRLGSSVVLASSAQSPGTVAGLMKSFQAR
jgi:hypothetical protein